MHYTKKREKERKRERENVKEKKKDKECSKDDNMHGKNLMMQTQSSASNS